MQRTWLALLIVTLATLPACHGRGPVPDPIADDLGRKIAGTWVGTLRVDLPEFADVAIISTYHADGTALTSTSRAFGAGDVERVGLSSTQHIQWEPAGERRIRWRLLHFGHHPDGTLKFVSRTHGTLEYDADFETGQGTFEIEVHDPASVLFPPASNDPRADPIFTARGTNEIERLHVGF
jgi:hypothetical protein